MKYITFIKWVQIVKNKFNETTLKNLSCATHKFAASNNNNNSPISNECNLSMLPTYFGRHDTNDYEEYTW